MNIKALPSVGSAFFVAFVLWSRRFAVPLQKESLGGASRGCTCLKCTNKTVLQHLLLRWCTTCYVGVPLATLVHLRQVHPLKTPP